MDGMERMERVLERMRDGRAVAAACVRRRMLRCVRRQQHGDASMQHGGSRQLDGVVLVVGLLDDVRGRDKRAATILLTVLVQWQQHGAADMQWR